MGEMKLTARLRWGVAAALVAELVFMAMVFVVLLVRGKDPWMVMRLPATFFVGPAAVHPPGFVPEDVLLGLLAHLWFSVLVGLVYAALVPRLPVGAPAAGLLTGGVLYVVGFWMLPQLLPGWLGPFWLPLVGRLLQAGAHAAYGLVLGYTYQHLQRRSV